MTCHKLDSSKKASIQRRRTRTSCGISSTWMKTAASTRTFRGPPMEATRLNSALSRAGRVCHGHQTISRSRSQHRFVQDETSCSAELSPFRSFIPRKSRNSSGSSKRCEGERRRTCLPHSPMSSQVSFPDLVSSDRRCVMSQNMSPSW